MAAVRPSSRRMWSPLDGLRALGEEVRSGTRLACAAAGAPKSQRDLLQLPDGSGPGVEVIFFDAEDRELGRQRRQAGGMMWWGPVQDGLTAGDIDHLQLATRLRVPASGRYSVGTSGLGEFRLVIEGEACSTRRSLSRLAPT